MIEFWTASAVPPPAAKIARFGIARSRRTTIAMSATVPSGRPARGQRRPDRAPRRRPRSAGRPTIKSGQEIESIVVKVSAVAAVSAAATIHSDAACGARRAAPSQRRDPAARESTAAASRSQAAEPALSTTSEERRAPIRTSAKQAGEQRRQRRCRAGVGAGRDPVGDPGAGPDAERQQDREGEHEQQRLGVLVVIGKRLGQGRDRDDPAQDRRDQHEQRDRERAAERDRRAERRGARPLSRRRDPAPGPPARPPSVCCQRWP